MKVIALIIFALFFSLTGLAQTVMTDSLRLQLRSIDSAIAVIDHNPNLVKKITYQGIPDKGTGYVGHTSFTDTLTGHVFMNLSVGENIWAGEIYNVNDDTFLKKVAGTDTTYYKNGKRLYTTLDINKEKIGTIVYSREGGRRRNFDILRITPTTINLYAKRWFDTEPIVQKKRSTPKAWYNLLNTFKLSDFDNIKNGNSKHVYDGIDVIITVITDKHTYILTNGDTDAGNYSKIAAFVAMLEKMGK